jgi:predicted ATP-dependent protease
VEGDSATCAEVYALLSSIAGIPIKQNLAITGSMNQHGEVQPIGGVNEKIEGFYEVCKLNKLNGEHSIIIPRSNMKNLMLKREVTEAVEQGKFHIYTIDTIEDGIEIFTGMPSGDLKPDGTYPEGTFNHMVTKKLQALSEAQKEKKHKDKKKKNKNKKSK